MIHKECVPTSSGPVIQYVCNTLTRTNNSPVHAKQYGHHSNWTDNTIRLINYWRAGITLTYQLIIVKNTISIVIVAVLLANCKVSFGAPPISNFNQKKMKWYYSVKWSAQL